MAMNGLERITDRILAEANEEADRVIAEAEAEAAKIRAEFEARADAIRVRLSDEAEREGQAMISRAKASAQNQKRDRMLAAESALVDEAFEGAKAAIRSLSTEKYTAMLAGLLSAALLEQSATEDENRLLYGEEELTVADRYEVLMNAQDRDRVGADVIALAVNRLTGKISPERLEKLVLAPQAVAIDGGLILRVGEIESNCSLSLLMKQLREELEGEVSRALLAPDGRA